MALTTTIGVFLSANKKKRSLIFAELYEFNEQLILNMKFNRDELKKIAAPYKFIPKILNGENVLTGDDALFIRQYLENLGKTDALSQIDYLTERQEALKKYKTDSFNDYKKYSSLYIKVFFMIGVLVAVLLA